MSPSVRVLQVVGTLDRGGIETWLRDIAVELKGAPVHLDFAVLNANPGIYAEELQNAGCRVVCCGNPKENPLFAANLLRVLIRWGPYDVVHSHVHFFNGPTLALARSAGVPVRVAHSHTDTRVQDQGASLIRKAYLRGTHEMIRKFATHGVAVSAFAALAQFGSGWRNDPRISVRYCGRSFSAFGSELDRQSTRRQLGISPDATVIGHVGRFVEAKNHSFFVEVADRLIERGVDAHFVLIGDGPLRRQIVTQVSSKGLSERFHLFRDVAKIADVMAALDLFLMPSAYEGLPLALLESQAAGLPCVYSSAITEECEAIDSLMHRMDLAAGPTAWAARIEAVLREGCRLQPNEASYRMEASPFSIRRSAQELVRLYRGDDFERGPA